MNQTQNLEALRNLFSFSSIKTETSLFRGIAKKDKGSQVPAIELPVNNYLKTPEEIEKEFQYGFNPGKTNSFLEKKDSQSNHSTLNSRTDGYINIHNLDEALSGFMEENY